MYITDLEKFIRSRAADAVTIAAMVENSYDLSIDILHDNIRFGSRVRGIGLVCTQGEEIGEGCGSCQELLVGAAEFLPAGSQLCDGLTNFFVFQ